MGLPLCCSGALVGVVGVANRKQGYDDALIEQLGPFLTTCANIISTARAELARQRAEARLREQQLHTQRVLDGLAEAVITIDEHGLIQSANQAMQRIFGHSPAELLGNNVSLLMLPPHSAEHDGYLKRYRETGEARVLGIGRQVEGKRRDGTRVMLDLSLSEVHVGDKRLFAGILRDLSEDLRAREQLTQLTAKLEQARQGQLVGNSEVMRRLLGQIDNVAAVPWPVVVEGETGTGKELVARTIHAASRRRDKPLIAVNCAALTESLLESRLFGHRRGAFTGASQDQPGFFETAHGGTLFLDEIGDISPAVQLALLRVLQEGEVVRLGETVPRKVDVRVIVATHRRLEEEVDAGRFRSDLFFRLRVGRVHVPALRERREDVPELAHTFLAQARFETGRLILDFEPDALEALTAHWWPGNVRELKNAVQYGVTHCQTSLISVFDLPPELRQANPPPSGRPRMAGLDSERGRVLRALARTGGKRTEAARLLGISRATFYRRLKELDIELA